jgi:hypothetical protein
MLLELELHEVRWLADLVAKDKLENKLCNDENPNYVYMVRRDVMANLEGKLEAAIQRNKQRGGFER